MAACARFIAMRLARHLVVVGLLNGVLHSAPNVLLIVSDGQRPDTIHALGNKVIETPSLDRLAARGTAFSRAYASYPLCQRQPRADPHGNACLQGLAQLSGGKDGSEPRDAGRDLAKGRLPHLLHGQVA